jgi:hypothetical protein
VCRICVKWQNFGKNTINDIKIDQSYHFYHFYHFFDASKLQKPIFSINAPILGYKSIKLDIGGLWSQGRSNQATCKLLNQFFGV